jgi:hypothetical protein
LIKVINFVMGSPAEAGSQIRSLLENHRLKSVAKNGGMSVLKILHGIAQTLTASNRADRSLVAVPF